MDDVFDYYRAHKDFQANGLLRHWDATIRHFPPEKKDSFLNYILLIHPEIAGVWLAYYSAAIAQKRWPEVEKYIFKHGEYSLQQFDYINRYVTKFNVSLKDIPKWVMEKIPITETVELYEKSI